jgi:hypothetical protein
MSAWSRAPRSGSAGESWVRPGGGRLRPGERGLPRWAGGAADLAVSLLEFTRLRLSTGSYGGDDFFSAPVVRRNQQPGRNRFQRGAGGLVELAGGGEGQSQVQPGGRGPSRPYRTVRWRLEPGEDLPCIAFRARVSEPGERGRDVGLGLCGS